MLGELRSVRWYTALALIAGGALLAILLAMLFDDDGGSASPQDRERVSVRIGRDAGGVGVRVLPPMSAKRESESPGGTTTSIPRMVGQRFMVGLREPFPTSALLQDARRGEIGGVVIFTENSTADDVRRAAAALQRAAAAGNNPQLLIATDQEGGSVKRLPEGPPNAPLSALSRGAAQREGSATGKYLRRHGINVDLAPVVDLGLPGSFMTADARTISANPGTVAAVAEAFSGGLEQTGVLPVIKHFPGLGSARQNTDEGRSVVEVGVNRSLMPFERLIFSGIPMGVMVSTAIYTKLDPDNAAAWSRKIVSGRLRHRLRFEGLVISDDLSSQGVEATLPTVDAVVASAKAGVDVLMVEPDSFRGAYEAVLAEAAAGRIPAANLTSSYERILDAKEGLPR